MAVILLLLYPISPAVVVGPAHVTQGNVNLGPAGTLLLGSIPGVIIGSRVAPLAPGKPLKTILAVMLIFVGVRLFFS